MAASSKRQGGQRTERPGLQDWILMAPMENEGIKLNGRDILGAGSFGEVYKGFRIRKTGDGQYTQLGAVAVKLEELGMTPSQLTQESKVYKLMNDVQGFPRLHFFGEARGYRLLAIDYLNSSIEEMFERCNRKFSLKTVLMLAYQMVVLIEQLHRRNFIHRDIKPDNFLIGFGKNLGQIHIIDFGLSKRYRSSETGEHIPCIMKSDITGTVRYCSINTHKGYEQSRRDDLEAVGYIIIYLMLGFLPWQGATGQNRLNKQDNIGRIKEKLNPSQLCQQMQTPLEIAKFIEYSRKLKFEEEPNYEYCKNLFKQAIEKEGYGTIDNIYEWNRNYTQDIDNQNHTNSGEDENISHHKAINDEKNSQQSSQGISDYTKSDIASKLTQNISQDSEKERNEEKLKKKNQSRDSKKKLKEIKNDSNNIERDLNDDDLQLDSDSSSSQLSIVSLSALQTQAIEAQNQQSNLTLEPLNRNADKAQQALIVAPDGRNNLRHHYILFIIFCWAKLLGDIIPQPPIIYFLISYQFINTHKGYEQSRRDDLEAVGYIIIYLMLGFLPWQGATGQNRLNKQDNIGRIKEKLNPSQLCQQMQTPLEIAKFIEYSRKLKFEEEPNYEYCKNLFKQAIEKEGYGTIDNIYEWNRNYTQDIDNQNHTNSGEDENISHHKAINDEKNSQQSSQGISDYTKSDIASKLTQNISQDSEKERNEEKLKKKNQSRDSKKKLKEIKNDSNNIERDLNDDDLQLDSDSSSSQLSIVSLSALQTQAIEAQNQQSNLTLEPLNRNADKAQQALIVAPDGRNNLREALLKKKASKLLTPIQGQNSATNQQQNLKQNLQQQTHKGQKEQNQPPMQNQRLNTDREREREKIIDAERERMRNEWLQQLEDNRAKFAAYLVGHPKNKLVRIKLQQIERKIAHEKKKNQQQINSNQQNNNETPQHQNSISAQNTGDISNTGANQIQDDDAHNNQIAQSSTDIIQTIKDQISSDDLQQSDDSGQFDTQPIIDKLEDIKSDSETKPSDNEQNIYIGMNDREIRAEKEREVRRKALMEKIALRELRKKKLDKEKEDREKELKEKEEKEKNETKAKEELERQKSEQLQKNQKPDVKLQDKNKNITEDDEFEIKEFDQLSKLSSLSSLSSNSLITLMDSLDSNAAQHMAIHTRVVRVEVKKEANPQDKGQQESEIFDVELDDDDGLSTYGCLSQASRVGEFKDWLNTNNSQDKDKVKEKMIEKEKEKLKKQEQEIEKELQKGIFKDQQYEIDQNKKQQDKNTSSKPV
ncbi:MAG: putative Casein kinase 1, partial [Streblomastix strix]